jgi:hypothetical protein
MLAPNNMRARIISLFTMITFGLQPLASLAIGYSAELISTRIAILINALFLFTGAALMFFFRDGLRQWELHPVSHETVMPKKTE